MESHLHSLSRLTPNPTPIHPPHARSFTGPLSVFRMTVLGPMVWVPGSGLAGGEWVPCGMGKWVGVGELGLGWERSRVCPRRYAPPAFLRATVPMVQARHLNGAHVLTRGIGPPCQAEN